MAELQTSVDPHRSAATQLWASVASRVKTAISDMHERHAWRDAFATWRETGELDGALDALGLTEGQIPTFIRNYPDAQRLLTAMTDRLGVDPGPEHLTVWRDLARICTLCSSHEECRAWLQSSDAEGYRRFCPNAGRFAGLPPKPRA